MEAEVIQLNARRPTSQREPLSEVAKRELRYWALRRAVSILEEKAPGFLDMEPSEQNFKTELLAASLLKEVAQSLITDLCRKHPDIANHPDA